MAAQSKQPYRGKMKQSLRIVAVYMKRLLRQSAVCGVVMYSPVSGPPIFEPDLTKCVEISGRNHTFFLLNCTFYQKTNWEVFQ